MREQITKIKEYAELAWASYAMLHYIEENDKPEDQIDKKLNLVRNPPARWIYADGIKRGYEIKRENSQDTKIQKLLQSNHRSLGQPTAYALAIEASFSEEKFIKFGENETPKKIGNKIQNLIKRDEDNPALENQEIKVSTAKEKMPEEQTSHYLFTRTKAFTSRYEVVEHQKNTKNGFSATLFKDSQNDDQFILVCRGTEPTLEDFSTDFALARGNIPLQCYELARFYEERVKNHLKEEKLLVIGHSLGGYIAQSFALMYPDRVKELYTFNSPGFLIDRSQRAIELFEFPVPNELRNYQASIETLKKNISALRSDSHSLPSSLNNAKILHIETTNTLNIQEHLNTWLTKNATQHLGKDIKGKYLFLYVSEKGLSSHYLDCTLKTLYFYEYLLQNQGNHSLFLKNSLQESIDALNIFIKIVYQNMYDQASQEVQENNKEKLNRCFYGNLISCIAFSVEMEKRIIKIPNPIIAILDKALFESTLITKEEKQDIQKIQAFEAIAYLQEHKVLISIMQDNTIKTFSSSSPLANLLSIYEFLPFIFTKEDNQPLIQNMQDFRTLTQRATSTKINVFSNTISEKMIEVYKKQTLFYSPERAYRAFVEETNKKEKEEKKVEIVAKDKDVEIEKISRYSRGILEEIGKESGVSILVISSITRTPEQQARAMLKNIKNTGIEKQYKIYGKHGDDVLKVFEEALGKRNLKSISQSEEDLIIKKMVQKIKKAKPHNVSKHCREDIHILNVIDISLAKYANNTTIIESLRKTISQKVESGKISKFIDEQYQNCFHIEIPQPKNKE